MFRLTTIPARRARPLAARATALPGLPIPFAPPPAAAAAVVSRRTAVQKFRIPAQGIVVIERSLASFKKQHKELGIKHTTPEQAYAIYQAGLEALRSKGSNPYWDQWFIKDLEGASAVAVHDTATFLYFFRDGTEGETHLIHHLLNMAAGMGHDASALSNAKVLLQMSNQKTGYFSYNGPAWGKTRERVAWLIKQGRDANAVVLEGLIHMNRKTHEDNLLAIDAFRRAWNLGKAASHFDWEATCLESWGDVQLRLGRKEDATHTFRRLMKLGFNRGFYRYAMMLEPGSSEYLSCLTHAAAAGMVEPLEPLMNEHLKRSEQCLAQGNKAHADEHRSHALEWSRVLEFIKSLSRG
ncbi:hypothetical protein CkaCkLH20_09433 [Colletotrichum karsti]|uniref:Uncharacterized protein n=1 Tax=Colletotrichum karsti TaxID=1095194 RepID=A0A9P6LGW2_9PEZI|nr:uncharacterized protein CkaCkLH20_09433 [Colletotrichum karsti]KAF9872923.1 hypothetical protein CkaCkLH20_09433 [Colletotrichum karsti]